MQAEKIAALHDTGEFQLLSGTVDSIDGQYRIATEVRHYSATRAFSCVIAPRVDDVVLFSVDAAQQCHILSIIERPGASDVNLDFPGDVTLGTRSGQLSIHADQDLNLVSRQGISQVAESYTLAAKKALLSIDDITAVGSNLVSKVRHVRTIADKVETVATHWLQKLKNSFRQVEGVDQFKTRDAIHTVENLHSLRTRQSVMLAEKDIRMDAERIHMG